MATGSSGNGIEGGRSIRQSGKATGMATWLTGMKHSSNEGASVPSGGGVVRDERGANGSAAGRRRGRASAEVAADLQEVRAVLDGRVEGRAGFLAVRDDLAPVDD